MADYATPGSDYGLDRQTVCSERTGGTGRPLFPTVFLKSFLPTPRDRKEPGDGPWNSYVSTSTLVVRHVNRHTNMGIPPVQLCERTDLCESLADIKDPTVWARERAV